MTTLFRSPAFKKRGTLTAPFHHATNTNSTAAGTSVSTTTPGSAGDLGLVFLQAQPANAPAAPSGWTLLVKAYDDTAGQTNCALWVYWKNLNAGDIGGTVGFSGLDSHSKEIAISAYSSAGGFSSKPAVWFNNGTENINSVQRYCPVTQPGPSDLVVCAVSMYGYSSLGNSTVTLTSVPSGATIRANIQNADNGLTFSTGLGVWDAASHAPRKENFASTSVAWSVGVSFSLSPVGAGWAESEHVPSTLAGLPVLNYGTSLTCRVAANSNTDDQWNTVTPWNDRITRALGSAAGSNNMGICGSHAEDICTFAYGTASADTRALYGGVGKLTQVGTFTAQTTPGLVILDSIPNDFIYEGAHPATAVTQQRLSYSNATEALIRLFRSSAVKGHADASVAYAGTWTTPSSTGYQGGAAHQTTVVGSTATITTTETALDLILIGQDDTKLGVTGSTFSVTVNGSAYTTGTVSNQAYAKGGSPDNGTGHNTADFGFVQMAVPVEGMPAGTNTIVITHTGSAGQSLAFNCWLKRAATPPWVFANTLVRFLAGDYTDNGGTLFSKAQQAAYDALLLTIVQKFTDGRVVYCDFRDKIDPSIWGDSVPSSYFLVDGVHMRDIGHAQMAHAALRALSEHIS